MAGSSFMQVRNTSAVPAATPGASSGAVTVRSTARGRLPRERATSSRAGDACMADV